MRLFTERGIPAVMVGTRGIERAHTDDEWVDVAELETLARVIARTLLTSAGTASVADSSA
jgi:acetylornithine deacetylase